MAVVVVLFGPKGAGKSQVAQLLREHHGVAHVDADQLVLGLQAHGARPDPELGWLVHVEQAVQVALSAHRAVSIEATGAWDSDWLLAEDLARAGQRVLRVWVSAPLQLTLSRLAGRGPDRVPVSPEQACEIHAAATRRAEQQAFDLRLDTEEVDLEHLPDAVAALAPRLTAAAASRHWRQP